MPPSLSAQTDTPSEGAGPAPPLTVNKTVLELEIPLHNSGPAGLGIKVYTKNTSAKVGGEMGVYIKSIVPGGAAAMVSSIVIHCGVKRERFHLETWPQLRYPE